MTVRSLAVSPGIRAIDSRMFERENVTSAYLIDAAEPALVETGSTRTVDEIARGLADLGIGPSDLAHVIVTHIHLDHAGGAGTFARRFPGATLWVHERGAKHLQDPAKLVASAARVFGAQRMEELFGPMEPVPADRLRAVTHGDRIDLGDRALEVVHTPGHASHHVALLEAGSGDVFVGDAFGVFLPDVRVLRPATAPPEFDLERAIADIRGIQDRGPERILFSHFGPVDEVTHVCELAVRRLERWTEVVEGAMRESEDLTVIAEALREGTERELNPVGDEGKAAVQDRYELLSSYEMNAMGIMRYLRSQRDPA